MEMTPRVLKQCCKEHSLYKTPSLNDKLYLNFKGFHTIENLEPYTAVRALFLEGNALDSLQGIPSLPELRCLFAQQNMIWEIDGLEGLDELDTINLSSNNIGTIRNLSHLPKLRTFICTNNRLASVEGIAHLAECKSLSVLDLSNNRIEGTMEDLLAVLTAMPNLTCLYLKGNPIVSQVKNYRKTLICSIKGLAYLDDRPVFELERKCAEGWAANGLEGEREARRLYREAEEEKDRRNHEAMVKLRQDGIRKRREGMGLDPEGPDPAFEEFSDDEWEEPEEPPELVAARRKLAEYSARAGEEEPVELTKVRQQLVREGRQVKESTRTVDTCAKEEEEGDSGEARNMGGEGTGPHQIVEGVVEAAALEDASQQGVPEEQLVESLGGHKVEVVMSADCNSTEEENEEPAAAGAATTAGILLNGNLEDLD
eukprot:CAMPEP_0117671370 /NCGR_PEP_ID=MMETSP0804-20121206/13295_1 /TAXON_ID=1074897 /ORGANISM="Tetraselmis astigmatica, Strain CCMP880" /LENGTH=426 /DNA_ID=CAMNT_0005479821 /DNA_START=64 /DNA_END=1344 /DNA_ORIENTATION=+